MDIKRARRLLANRASTRQELEQLFREALAGNQRELAFDIKDAMDERFPTVLVGSRGKQKASLGHFVAYHSRKKMGYTLRLDGRESTFLSNKGKAKLEAAIGEKVWIITGAKGKDRKTHYHCAGFFVPRAVDTIQDPDFKWKISGPLTKFKKRVPLDDLSWFHVLREKWSPRFGITSIVQPEIVKELEGLARKHT